MLLILTICLALFPWKIKSDSCADSSCKFNFFQQIYYGESACFEKSESFSMDNDYYLAYCTEIHDDSTNPYVTIARYNTTSTYYETVQTLDLDVNDCEDINYWQNPKVDNDRYLVVCGRKGPIHIFKYDANTTEFTLSDKTSSSLYDHASCQITQVFDKNTSNSSNDDTYYLIASLSYSIYSLLWFYKFNFTLNSFDLSKVTMIYSFDLVQISRFDTYIYQNELYLFAAILLDYSDSTTTYQTRSYLFNIYNHNDTFLNITTIDKIETNGAIQGKLFDLGNVNNNSLFLAIANSESDISTGIPVMQYDLNTKTLTTVEYFYIDDVQSINFFIINDYYFLSVSQSQNVTIYKYSQGTTGIQIQFDKFQTISFSENVDIYWTELISQNNEYFISIMPCSSLTDKSSNWIYAWSNSARETTTSSPIISKSEDTLIFQFTKEEVILAGIILAAAIAISILIVCMCQKYKNRRDNRKLSTVIIEIPGSTRSLRTSTN